MKNEKEADLIDLGRSEGGFFASKVVASVANILTVLSWFGLGSTVIGTAITRAWAWIALGLIPVFVLFVIRYGRKHKSQALSQIMRWLSPAMPYMLKEWNAVYEYIDETKMRFEATYVVKALQVGVDYIVVRFNWSGDNGDNSIVPRAITNREGFESTQLVFIGSEYGYSYYKLYASHPHNKGETFKLGVHIEDMNVTGKEPSPHLLTSVSAVTDVLRMSVVLPSSIYPVNATCREYINSTDFYYWKSEKITAKRENNKWNVSKNLKNPIYGGKYVIEWEPQPSTSPTRSSEEEKASLTS